MVYLGSQVYARVGRGITDLVRWAGVLSAFFLVANAYGARDLLGYDRMRFAKCETIAAEANGSRWRFKFLKSASY